MMIHDFRGQKPEAPPVPIGNGFLQFGIVSD